MEKSIASPCGAMPPGRMLADTAPPVKGKRFPWRATLDRGHNAGQRRIQAA